jgi:hypothetical protein
MHRILALPRILTACLVAFLCSLALPALGGGAATSQSPRRLSIVVGETATKLERLAAEELAVMLGRLFKIKAEIAARPDDAAAAVILVGRPSANPALAQAVGSGWPNLTDQGIVLRRLRTAKPTLVVGGGSPVATLWAVYELGERWDVRFLHDRDVYPAQKPFDGLPELDVVMEPNMRTRCWRLVNEHATGPVSWSLEENRRFLRQMAKMKFNRVHLELWPCQPFAHYTFHGMVKPSGVLFFGRRYPIDEDTIGREHFAGMKSFTNPDLVGATTPEEVRGRAIALIHGILAEARRLGMQTGLSVQPFEWPKEFLAVLPGSEAVPGMEIVAGPGASQSIDDPLLREMVSTIVRSYVETYPEAEYLHVDMPEFRQWTGLARQSYDKLCARYDAKGLGSFEELCARARSRTTFPGGGQRVEAQVKGDLAALCFFDSLVREKQLLARPGGRGEIKLVYAEVSEELFPLVARMLPPGGEVRSVIDYTASRVLRQRDLLKQTPPKNVPASLIFTLDDDNVGVLPQLATGSLHTLMGDLRANGWAGFYTRYWTVSQQDPVIHYLARASWIPSMTPERAYADQVSRVCGPEAVEPVRKALAIVEQITLGMDQHGLGLAFPVPDMMAKHYRAEELPAAVKEDRDRYRKALSLMQQAHESSSLEGRKYVDYYVGRLWFAIRYLDAAEAYGETARAEKAGHKQDALRHAEAACQAIRDALNAQAEVARDHGDLGAVAVMNEYCYRPIRDKRNQLRGAEARK